MNDEQNSDAPDSVEGLSPAEQRALLERLLREEASEPQVFPTSFAQERLWFLEQFNPSSAAYNIPIVLRLPGPLNPGALEQALNEVVRRHEVLRTGFQSRDGMPVQVVAPELELPLRLVDLRELPEQARELEAQRLVGQELQRPFPLEQAPLLRALLVRIADVDHVLALVVHHIVTDGWSMGVFFRELNALYEVYSAGRPSPLPDLPLQYADFACWQRERLEGEALEEQLAYWRPQLEGAPAVLELPADHTRPAVQSFRGGVQPLVVPAPLVRSLERLAQSEGATLFMALLAAFKTLLHRYSGKTDLVLGTPIANRSRVELEQLIGFFVNTLVLRTDTGGDPSYRQLLQRVREVTLGAYAHQDLPFEKLVSELQPERRLSHNPLFQVMFVYQSAPAGTGPARQAEASPGSDLGGWTGALTVGTAKFDLTLALQPAPDGGLTGMLEYSLDLFEPDTIARMAGHLFTLLEGIARDPDARLSRLPLLTEPERQVLLHDWNATEAPWERVPVHELVEAQVGRTPDAIAVAAEHAELSYRELDERANRLAHHLRSLGVGPETRVGICLQRSLALPIALLAVLKAGGAYVPLDPDYPPDRLAFMLDDARVPVLLSAPDLAARLPAHEAVDVFLDPDGTAEALADYPAERPRAAVGLDNLCYVLYTSGSTGRPKGAMVSHASLSNHMQWMRSRYPLEPGEALLQKTPFSFDVSIFEFFWPLIVGAVLVMARPGAQGDFEYLEAEIRDRQIQVVFFVSSSVGTFAHSVDPAACTSLRHVFCGGEALAKSVVQDYFARFDAPLHNLYGPTESTIDTTVWDADPNDPYERPPIGRPVSNIRLYVLDQGLEPVPAGVPGELFIGGAGLARGYLERPALTGERFLPDPFGPEPGARLYGTGDLVRYRRDGNVDFLGRLDHQVKVRGFRIELGEIEAVLGEHPQIDEAVVVAREDGHRDRRLVAYLTSRSGALEHKQLRAYLRERLADYMLPSAFVTLERLPLSPSGKVDRNALPAPEGTRPELEQRFLAPNTPTEKLIAATWAELLGLERVGLHDNFFELGGHSLLGTQALARLREALRIDIPLRRLFDQPTVAGLAAALADTPEAAERIDRIAELTLQVDKLSPDELQAILARSDERGDGASR